MKKSVSFLLVLVLAFSCMLSVQVYGYEVAESKLAFNADFSSTSASPGSFLGGTLATIDSTYGTSYKLSGSSTAYFYANFDASRYEATSLSFDVYAESETARGVLEIFDPVAPGNTYIADANVHRTLYIKQDGLVSTFNKFNVGGEGRYYPVKYAAGEWTHYDIWIDYVLGSVLCYKNEELLGELSKDNFKIFGGFRYVFNDMGSGTSHYLDNVSVYNHIARGRITVGNFQGVPNNIKAGVAFLYPREYRCINLTTIDEFSKEAFP